MTTNHTDLIRRLYANAQGVELGADGMGWSPDPALYREAADALEAMQAEGWQHIDTAPQDGYMLVHEDGALRALMRIKGVWHKPGYPALVANNYWADVLVGNDAKRVLDPLGYHLELRDGCCENPTHWMPLPRIPDEQEP